LGVAHPGPLRVPESDGFFIVFVPQRSHVNDFNEILASLLGFCHLDY
jgi:hypothetical protein